MLRAPLATIFFGLLLVFSSKAKPNGKDKKAKQVVPDIECDARAGKISFPEFIVRCPSSCRETKEKVYGTGVFASISSICNAAIHNGVITNAGGKVIVKKMAGQEPYKGTFANGIRSLSLPKWRESFTVSVGKPKKGVIYPATLESQKEHSTTSPTTPAPEPTTTTSELTTTTTTTTTTPPPTTPTTTMTTTVRPRAAVHKVRDAASDPRPEISEYERWYFGQYPPQPADTDSGPKHLPETLHTRVEPVEVWKPEGNPFDLDLSDRGKDPLPRVPDTQGNTNCKVDIAFLMDGSWSIGKRRFKIQKDFLSEVSQVINVGINGPMMGIIQYGDDPVTEFSLRQFSSSKDLKPAIDKIIQKGGLSNVGTALFYVNKHFFSDANGNRGGAPNVVVVLVDGWPTDKVEEASRLARESGINIFFVTIEGPDDSEKHNVVEANFVDKAVCRTNGFFSLPVTSWFALRKAAQPLVKRVCDTDRLVCSKTCLNANDIAFVIDGSSSVGTGNFRTVLQFVANVTREFEISDTDTRIGAVQYTYEQRLEFAFGQHNTKADVLNAIRRINYWSGGTSTGAAITYAAEKLFSKSKPNKRKIMIVITDGRSYDDVRAPALAVHRSGVIAYSIGIAWAAQDELEYIATDPDKDHSFFVDEFDNLYKYVPKIIHNICHEFNSQPRN
ncbi:vitrin isoform X12 [Ictalurus furcatus]|uniref:vitrin isoform X12 n=1 Tax=Ictalurus furcatus TaxID=66913 RepID=UPI00235000C4|nr:vitrin isoform X12 [Ictalurus furcatus]